MFKYMFVLFVAACGDSESRKNKHSNEDNTGSFEEETTETTETTQDEEFELICPFSGAAEVTQYFSYEDYLNDIVQMFSSITFDVIENPNFCLFEFVYVENQFFGIVLPRPVGETHSDVDVVEVKGTKNLVCSGTMNLKRHIYIECESLTLTYYGYPDLFEYYDIDIEVP